MSPPPEAEASPTAALLRRVLVALGVAAAFVVLGLLFSGDRADAATPDEPKPVADVLDLVDETVDAVVEPVEELAAPIVEPVVVPLVAPIVEPVLATVETTLTPTPVPTATDAVVEIADDEVALATTPRDRVAAAPPLATTSAATPADERPDPRPAPEPRSDSDASTTAPAPSSTLGLPITSPVGSADLAHLDGVESADPRTPPVPSSDSTPD